MPGENDDYYSLIIRYNLVSFPEYTILEVGAVLNKAPTSKWCILNKETVSMF